MKNNKKTIIIISIILGVLVLTLGLTYAMLSISKTGQNSSLVVGDVYMHYANGSKSINLANVLPSDTYDATSFFEFTIDGKNTTTNKDIWYEIILKHGDNLTGKTRIKDNLLKFTLTETKNGTTTTVFDGRSYKDLTSKRIWVNTINKNTTSEISITYRLYMWISNTTVIGNVNQDYTTEEWKNIFASIKVDVAGDFNEKILATDESCFTAGTTKTYKVNNNMTTEELNKCTTHITNLNWNWNDGETPEAFCKGTGTNRGYTFQTLLNGNLFGSEDLSYFENNNIITSTTGAAILDYDETCGSDVIIPSTIKGYPVTVIGNSSTTIVKQLSNKVNNYSFDNLINNIKANIQPMSQGVLASFESKNLTSVVIPDSVTLIASHAFANNQLASIIIPDSVTIIEWSAFANNQLATIVIPNSVNVIAIEAFANNQLTNITIPSNVAIIGYRVFYNNQLTSVEFSNPSKLERIETSAFRGNNISTVSIPETVTYLSCDAFDSTVVITKSDSLVCTQSGQN